jgi:hypothetical protein
MSLSTPADLPHEIPAAIDSSTAIQPIPEDAQPHRWPLPSRIGFRFAFCYLGGYCLFNGNATVWSAIPLAGDPIQDIFAKAFALPAQYLAQHLFHVAPPGNRLHPTGSGDTAINWIALLILFCASLIATAIWTAFDRRRPHYQSLAAWLRFLIRLTLGIGMVTYGLAKIFPLQMPPPTIANLNEPLGLHSPMNLLWSFIGLNPAYEMICGAAEFLAGCLILFRRTALAGAIFTAFVVTNVLLFNLFFDVPVKLYAGHLLLLSLFVILPDARSLFSFFWSHQPAAPTGIWVPPATRPWFRRTTVAIEIGFVVLALGVNLINLIPYWRTEHLLRTAPCPLCGAWRIDSANILDAAGSPTPHPLPTTNGGSAVELNINNPTRGSLADSSGRLSNIQLTPNFSTHTLTFAPPEKPAIIYSVSTPDSTHLILTPVGDAAKTSATLNLTLLTPPGGYPLVHRGFHWISEFPYQR